MLAGLRYRTPRASVGAAAVLAIAAGSAIGGGCAAAGATQSSAPSLLLRQALADADAQGSVHQVSTDVTAGERATFTDDVAARTGRQDITLTGGSLARVVVVGPTAYFEGNQRALTAYFGIPLSVARELGSRWVEVPSSNRAYGSVSAAATLPSALSELTPTGHLTETTPMKVGGVAVVGIRGAAPTMLKQPGKETLYLSRTRYPLPVSATLQLARSGAAPASTISTTLTHWEEPLRIGRPANSIPISRLSTSSELEASASAALHRET